MNKKFTLNGFASFAGLTIVDKGFNFIAPLLFLLVYHSTYLYAKIEYIFSFAAILLPFADLGLRNYMFYDFRTSSNPDESSLVIHSIFSAILLIYFALIICMMLVGFEFIGWMIMVRLSYMLTANYLTNYYRLKDRPSYVYIFSTATMFLAIVTVLLLLWINPNYGLFGYHIVLFIGCIIVFLSVFRIRYLSFAKVIAKYKQSIKFTWPIMINLIVVSLLGNYAKIYIYHHFSADEMSIFSLLQRFSYSIVLIHISMMGYFSKALYVQNFQSIKAIMSKYFRLMVLGSIAVFVICLIVLHFWVGLLLKYVVMSFFLVFYSSCWAMSSFYESLFGRVNRNIYILIINSFALLIFYVLICAFADTLLMFSMAMFLSMLFSLLAAYGIYRFKIQKMIIQSHKIGIV